MADEAYGVEHQKRRAELLPTAYGTPCPRCGEVMLESDELDLGHSVDLALDAHAIGDRIEHASCNRSAGAKLKSRLERYKPSRNW
ncbi:hypothetical protein [Microbacterium karelineae]|uniref:hypothetical protein n=1 Tax=Microbacterium karelineae TaxID=2654283 RepID=UPI0012E99403|nr:hypothetical protein [Microbacterium karelineae]